MEAEAKIPEIPRGFYHRTYRSLLFGNYSKIRTSAHEKTTEEDQIGNRKKQNNAASVLPRMHKRAATPYGKNHRVYRRPAIAAGAVTPAKTDGNAAENLLQKVSKHPLLILKRTGTEKSGGLGETLHASLPEFIRFDQFFLSPPGTQPMKGATTACSVGAAPSNNARFSGIMDGAISLLVEETGASAEAKVAARRGGKGVEVEAFKKVRFINDWRQLFLQVSRKGSVRTAA